MPSPVRYKTGIQYNITTLSRLIGSLSTHGENAGGRVLAANASESVKEA
jgi:hypothetical protein